nr:hypothetical protein Iba_chr13fCG6030 [Ipomoea batatas]GMD82229.1 hypothetical protein Iba_chr13fCG6040 [Ipomoea batatas]
MPDPAASSELLLLPSHWNAAERRCRPRGRGSKGSFAAGTGKGTPFSPSAAAVAWPNGRGWRGVGSVKAFRRLRTPLLCFVAPLPEERGSEKSGEFMGSKGVAGFSSPSSNRAPTLEIITVVTTPSFARSKREELATPRRARRRALPRRVTSFFTLAGGGDGELGFIVGSLPLHDVAITTEALWP